ncbi:MAG: hypothetical protein WC091_23390 [Sulfuricellaceae bacterium]
MSVKVVLLCEDIQIACFMRRFLKRRGLKSHEIREEISPPGKCSGEQWVREKYPDELKAMRRQGGVTLFVGTDADTLTVKERINTLTMECKNRSIPEQAPDEHVVMVAPKRNIETWLAYLRGAAVNEDDNYPRYSYESECRNDVKTLDQMCLDRALRSPAPPSLLETCKEYRKTF